MVQNLARQTQRQVQTEAARKQGADENIGLRKLHDEFLNPLGPELFF